MGPIRQVLIVDPEFMGRAESIERDTGLVISVAPSAAIAERLILRASIDAVFTEVDLPDREGAQWLFQLRERLPKTSIIVITQNEKPQVLLAAVNTNVLTWITKTRDSLGSAQLPQDRLEGLFNRALQAVHRTLFISRAGGQEPSELAGARIPYWRRTPIGQVAFAEWDVVQDRLKLEPDFVRSLGYPESDADAGPELWQKRLPPRDQRKIMRQYRRLRGNLGAIEPTVIQISDASNEIRSFKLVAWAAAREFLNRPTLISAVLREADEDDRLLSIILGMSHRAFADCLQSCPLPILLIDPNTHQIVDVNDAADVFFRYVRGVLCTLRFPQIVTMPLELITDIMSAVGAAGKKTATLPLRISDGKVRYVTAQLQPVTYGFRRLVHCLLLDTDVLSASSSSSQSGSDSIRTAIDTGFDAFMILKASRDPLSKIVDFEIVEFNRRVLEIFEVPEFGREAFFSNAFTGSFKDDAIHKYARVANTSKALEEELKISLSTRDVWIRHQVVPLPDGVAVTASDITESKRAEESLKASEHRANRMIETAQVGIVGVSREERVLVANLPFCEMIGGAKEEVVGRDFFDFVEPSDRIRARSCFDLGNSSTRVSEWRFVHKTHGPVWTLVSRSPFPFDPGSSEGWLFIVTNISEYKEAEQQLRSNHEQMAHMSRLSTMGQMAAELAHEINQPLFSISNFADATGHIAREEKVNPLIVEYAERCASAARRAAEIVRRVNHFARKSEPFPEPFNLNDCIRDVVAMLGGAAKKSKTDIRFFLDPDILTIVADRLLIEQVIVNLVRNAIEALTEHGMEPKRVEIETKKLPDSKIRIAVRDNGPGVAPEIEEKLFEPYATTKPDGLGLGLSICGSIVEAHGGKLTYHRLPNGSEFAFVIPIAAK